MPIGGGAVTIGPNWNPPLPLFELKKKADSSVLPNTLTYLLLSF
jgi:hypothetical protein